MALVLISLSFIINYSPSPWFTPPWEGLGEAFFIVSFLLYLFPYGGGKTFAVIIRVVDMLSDSRTADVNKGCVGNGDTIRDIPQLTSGPGIYNNLVVCQYLLALVPHGEALPVVGSYYQNELSFWELLSQMLQGMDHIGGAGQAELVVADFQVGNIPDGKRGQLQPGLIIQQFLVDLERVLGGYQQPHLIYKMCVQQSLAQLYVPVMNGIKGASVESGSKSLPLAPPKEG